jgi:hypothetical protein
MRMAIGMALAGFWAVTALAQGPDWCKPGIRTVDSAFYAFKHWGAEQAAAALLKGGILEGGEAQRELGTRLQTETAGMGTFHSHEIVAVHPVTERSAYCLATLNFQKGAIFLKLLLYANTSNQVVINGWALSGEPFPEFTAHLSDSTADAPHPGGRRPPSMSKHGAR